MKINVRLKQFQFGFSIFLLCGLLSVVGVGVAFAEDCNSSGCPPCYSCAQMPDAGGYECIVDNDKGCQTCDGFSYTCTVDGGATCAGGSCNQLSRGCACNNGSCSDNYYCQPECPSGYGVTNPGGGASSCTVICNPCGNTVTCYQGGTGSTPTPGTGECVCACNSVGYTDPGVPTGLTYGYQGGSAVPVNTFRLEWDAPGDWGYNVKSCISPAIHCPDGELDDGQLHAYQVVIYEDGVTFDPSSIGSYYNKYVFYGQSFDYDGAALDECTEYNWRVRAINRMPPTSFCNKSNDRYSDWSDPETFRTNCLPTVVSVTPPNGVSGTEPDTDNGPASLCTDNNPATLTVRYSDPDGIGDIVSAGIWMQGGAHSWLNLDQSLHKMTKDGTRIKINVFGRSTGDCNPSAYPQQAKMELLVDDEVVRSWYVPNTYMQYAFNTSDSVSPNRIKIRFQDQCCFSSGGGAGCDLGWRVLLVDKIRVNGVTVEAENLGNDFYYPLGTGLATETINTHGKNREFVRLGQTGGYVQFSSNSTTLGSDNRAGYGANINAAANDFICNGSVLGCFANYDWAFPSTGDSIYGGGNTFTSPSLWTGNVYSDARNGTNYGEIKVNSFVGAVGGSYLDIEYEVEFFDNPVYNFDSQTLNVFGYAQDMALSNSGWVNSGSWFVDLTPPTGNFGSFKVQDKQTFRIPWRITENSGAVLRSQGFGGLFPDGSEPLPYSAGSQTMRVVNNGNTFNVPVGGPGSYTYTSSPIWEDTSFPGGLIGNYDIDIGTVDEGRLGVKMEVVDNACNAGEFESDSSCIGQSCGVIGSAWMTTKAGLVYSGGAVALPVLDSNDSDTLAMPGYDNFEFRKDQVQVSTELLLASGPSAIEVYERTNDNKYFNPYIRLSAGQNTAGALLYNDLIVGLTEKISKSPDEYDEVVLPGDTIDAASTGSTSDICSAGKEKCVIRANSGLTVEHGAAPGNEAFVCDLPTAVIVANGPLNINSNIETDVTGDFSKNGCIFISQGDINIQEGVWQSQSGGTPTSKPNYDLLQGYFLAFGNLSVEATDETNETADGLRVDGSLIGLGLVSPSVEFKRSLKLRDNVEFPSVAVHFDPRYLYISREFFTDSVDVYRKGIGFKPY
ncbi:hypothetical protein GF357_02265 [Candidatus Dojkabacteria bacterium]|nr:hypothetical protein [Candidatus Dojkabacteria bacterium]